MKNILLIVDMEGCCGLYDMTNAKDCKLKMELEVNYILDTLHQMRHENIAVLDCHNDGKTLMEFCNKNNIKFYNHIWSINDADKYDFAFLIGFHSKKGVEGYFSHTIRPDIDQMFLGEKSIGEVELLINWMAFYGVPVVYVSGDESIKYELGEYKGEFIGVKSVSNKKIFLDDIKGDIFTHIEHALLNDIKAQYIPSKIIIKPVGINYIKFIPSENFQIVDNSIEFEDTIEFVEKLKTLCEFLNISEMYQYKRVNLLLKELKKYSKNFINDARANELLNDCDWRTLDDDDILYLAECCKRVKNSLYH